MINVAYCSDSKGYYGLEASLYSLLTHTKNVNLYIFTMDYERKEYDQIVEYEGLLTW
jgi:lipopolysaccharide biosynthesis glycosyltransferase